MGVKVLFTNLLFNSLLKNGLDLKSVLLGGVFTFLNRKMRLNNSCPPQKRTTWSTSWEQIPTLLGPGENYLPAVRLRLIDAMNHLSHDICLPFFENFKSNYIMFPSARHLYTATSDGETMTCVTCELQVQPSSSLKTFSRITTFIFARIIGSLQTSRGEFCQRSSVLPNWSFSHYVHSCLGQVGPTLLPAPV